MSRARTVPALMITPTHSRPEGACSIPMTETAIHTRALPEGHFAAIVMSRPESVGKLGLSVVAILDRDEVEEHIRLLRNAMEDAELLDAGLSTKHAQGPR
ncbi:hypothetical protein GCM10022268_17030 [Sphingomonas cynarae]|uniref:Uncharacterized protein n=1 Tax=Sphingomonas cynarae TaxID=930197 RepID=A0ABP7DP89_9SPHN